MKLSDDKTKNKLYTLGAVVALYFILDRYDTQNKKNIAEEDIANIPAASQASEIKSLLRPY